MNAENSEAAWRKCSSCKKPILPGAKYFVCSVSTCNGQRTGYVFCSMMCFESHLPGARHRDAGAVEKTAPGHSAERAPARIIVASPSTAASQSKLPPKLPQETLIIASRLKEYINAKSGYNTSGSVMDVLSDFVRAIAHQAIDNARVEGRKTVLDRDLEFLRKIRF